MANSAAVLSMYDEPMWESIRAHDWHLQQCDDCSEWRYPPGPCCPKCLSPRSTWRPLSGRGEIASWVVFHRQYFDNWPPPYNVVAVKLAEGPLVISNLTGPEPEGSWIGRSVEVTYGSDAVGTLLPQMRLAE